MARKPAKMYTKLKGQAYTRRKYMGGVPGSRLLIWDMGNRRAEFPVKVSLIAKEQCQIRHTALEAARIIANRTIQKRAGQLGYHLKVRVYPHHILRENKIATGAGADRVSDGMRHSFGKAIGRAARIHPGQRLLTASVNPNHFKWAKAALRKASMKLPTPCRLVVDKGEDLVR